MAAIGNWFKQSSPVVKALMAIGITSGIVLIHRFYYRPFVRKQRYLEAKNFADILEVKTNPDQSDQEQYESFK